MAKRTANFNSSDVRKLANDKPVVYRIQTAGGNDNYVGVAKRGRVGERVAEHIGEVPGAKVTIQQRPTIRDAIASEARIVKRQQPKYNKNGK